MSQPVSPSTNTSLNFLSFELMSNFYYSVPTPNLVFYSIFFALLFCFYFVFVFWMFCNDSSPLVWLQCGNTLPDTY